MFLPITEENISTLLIDGSVIFLLVAVIIETQIMRHRGNADDKLFYRLIVMNIIMAVFDIITYLADEKSFSGARLLNLGGVTAFYIMFVLLFMAWYHYALIRFKKIDSTKEKASKAFFIPGLVMEALIIINIFTGWIFSVDKHNIYHRGFLFIPMFLVLGFYVVLTLNEIVKYRAGTKNDQLIPVWIFVLPLVVGLAVPFYYGGISLTAAGCAMSIVFTHLGSASEIVNYDAEGGDK